MNDMTPVIVPKSDQINADDLIAGPMTITIRDVQIKGGQEQPVSIYFEGSDKAFRPCKSMSRVFVQAWGADAKAYIGRSVTLYRDPEVKWGGLAVGGIRISHMSDIDGPKQMMLTATKGSRKPHKVLPLAQQAAPKAQQTTTGFDAVLARLEQIAVPGNLEELGLQWKSIGPDARKALAEHLPRLKAACEKPATAEEDDALAPWLAAIDTASDLAKVDQLDKESETDRPFMTDEQTTRLDEALATKRAALRELESAA